MRCPTPWSVAEEGVASPDEGRRFDWIDFSRSRNTPPSGLADRYAVHKHLAPCSRSTHQQPNFALGEGYDKCKIKRGSRNNSHHRLAWISLDKRYEHSDERKLAKALVY